VIKISSNFSRNSSKSENLRNFAAHLKGAHGTHVRRGTPFEKHWFGVINIGQNKSVDEKYR
jgi:hypothetical protein